MILSRTGEDLFGGIIIESRYGEQAYILEMTLRAYGLLLHAYISSSVLSKIVRLSYCQCVTVVATFTN